MSDDGHESAAGWPEASASWFGGRLPAKSKQSWCALIEKLRQENRS